MTGQREYDIHLPQELTQVCYLNMKLAIMQWKEMSRTISKQPAMFIQLASKSKPTSKLYDPQTTLLKNAIENI